MRSILLSIISLVVLSSNAYAEVLANPASQPLLGSVNPPSKVQGVGLRTASQAAVGQITVSPLNYIEVAVIGIAIITNNNDNDGQPATFTGGSGSNMAGGG